MSIVHATLTLPSKLMVFIGNTLIGDPKKLGVEATAEEFYAKQTDRPLVNPDLINKAGDWSQMMRNYQVDFVRRKIFGRLCIYSSIFILAMSLSGSIAMKGVDLTIDAKNKVVRYFDNKSKFEKQEKEFKAKAETLKEQFKKGELTQDEFKAKATELEEEFKQLKKGK